MNIKKDCPQGAIRMMVWLERIVADPGLEPESPP